MLTKCPGCGTTFRVSPAQLKARAGQVRCGQCGFVFNALETLADDGQPPLPNPLPQGERELPPIVAPSAEMPAPIPESEPMADLAEAEEPCAPSPLVGEGRGEGETTEAEIPALPESEAEDSVVPAADYLADVPQREAAKTRRRWPWVLGSLAALCGLTLQTIYYYRVELAVLRPELRPLLQAACMPLGCAVPRPRHIDTLGIEASDLHPDPQQPGRLTLTATLRSKAVYAQEWPLLELTLTDVADRKLAVKHFAPSDYLPRDKNSDSIIAAGFPANGETAVALSLDIGTLPAAGYRLYIFYP